MEISGVCVGGTIRKVVEASNHTSAIEAFRIFMKKLGLIEHINKSIKPPFKSWAISILDEDDFYYYLQIDYLKEEK